MSGNNLNDHELHRSYLLGAFAVVLMTVIFLVDMQIPLGVAAAVPYVAVVLLGLWVPQKRFIVFAAILCSLLTIYGLIKSPPSPGELWKVYANRGLSLFAIWVTAGLCFLQKTKTAALADSELFTRSIVSNMFNPLIVIDERGHIVSFNQAAERCFGYSFNEVRGKNVAMLMPEPERNQHDFYIKRFLETGQSRIMGKGLEVAGLRKNGEKFPMDLHLSEMRQNRQRLFIGMVLDISQRKKSQEALEASENKYHTLFDQLSAVMEGTTHATGEEFLRSLVSHLGLALKTQYAFVGELLGERKDIIKVRAFWSADNGFVSKPLEYSLKGSPCEQVIARKQVAYFPKDVQKTFADFPMLAEMGVEGYIGYPLFDAKDNIIGHLVVMHSAPLLESLNVNMIMPIFVARAEVEMERERAEHQLRLLFAAVEQSPSAVVIADSTGKIVYANPSLLSSTGFSLEEVIGGSPRLWKSGIHPPEFYKHLWETILEGKEWRSDICNRKKNGDLYWELLSILPLKNAEDQVTHFIAVKVDDTERRNAEKKMQHYARELERSNQALNDFAAIASHDLQEPLRKVAAFGERLRENINDNGLDYLERMLKATVRMQKFISDLLEYSRVSAKARIFNPVNLQDIVADVLSDLEVRIIQSKAKVETGSLPTLSGDELQLRQLFQNLIANALKFHKKDTPPVVTINSCHASEKGLWTITVADNGVGFDQKSVERIFKPFERLHGRSEYEGSGIGLAICQKIVQRHGGEITARSIPLTGTKFIVTLPDKQSQETILSFEKEIPDGGML